MFGRDRLIGTVAVAAAAAGCTVVVAEFAAEEVAVVGGIRR